MRRIMFGMAALVLAASVTPSPAQDAVKVDPKHYRWSSRTTTSVFFASRTALTRSR